MSSLPVAPEAAEVGVDRLFAELEAKIREFRPKDDLSAIEKAYRFASAHHSRQKRDSGEPYMNHPLMVSHALADMRMDLVSIETGLLHDVVEDTDVTIEEIRKNFGEEVARCVDGVTKLGKLDFYSAEDRQAESFRKMLLAMVEDIRVIIVKLADRLHNMRTLDFLSPERQQRIAKETLEIYAPIAHRLGMGKVRGELEDLAFRYTDPEGCQDVRQSIETKRHASEELLNEIRRTVEAELRREGIPAKVESRMKRAYSVYQKMKRQKIGVDQVYDLLALRIITDSVKNCYAALGVIHNEWRPVPGRIKDFIAIPRPNLYQSLHTSVIGPQGQPFEVQIRTEEMHRMADSGIAAHWQYKTGEKDGETQQARAREWLQGVMDLHEGSAEELVESVRVDLFPDKVYVFTPKGDIMRLPRGATCVDFAYAVHTGVGQRCVAAKVDRRLVPLRTQLRNGQTVEIITAKGAQPNPAWASFVATAKARSAIRQYLKTLKKGEAAELGGRMLNQALEEFELTVKKLPEGRLDEVARSLSLKDGNELLEKIGLGERLARLVARRLLPDDDTRPDAKTAQSLTIAGTEGLIVSYARCCFPIPYDAIVAYLSSGRGVVIHRDNCSNVAAFGREPDKWISAVWQKDQPSQHLFSAGLMVEATNRMGILAEIATRIAGEQSNISHVNVDSSQGDHSTILFEVQVRDRGHLARLIRAIRGMPDVMKVERSLA